ncbi:TonB-dependent siderophore receptor [Rhodopseudomonas sp.]|uniref:TonB-dependent siderophore receptor n=1 Tax=Rhodopseudomonas sp. TaxID=1078 RepID=UPI0039E3061C
MTTRPRWPELLQASLALTLPALVASPALAQQAASPMLPPVTVEGGTQRATRVAPKPRAATRATAERRAAAPAPAPAPIQATPRENARGPVRGIVAGRSATGTKTDASLLETPQSISVVTRDQIQQQAARSVAEALRYEPGVISESRVGDRFDNVFIRGFGGFGSAANYLHYWDSLRLPRGVSYAMPSVDPYLLERVEVLRGPASVLYGQNNLGGMVNLISKAPTATPQGEVFTRFGDHNRIEGGFDISGPLTKDGDLLYRLIGLGRKANTEVDYTTTERRLIAPMITWTPSADTKLTVRATYDKDPSSYQPNWLPAVGTLLPNAAGQIPKDFFSGSPNVNRYAREQTSVGYEFEHHFNDTWAVRQNLRYMELTSDFKALSVTGFATAANSCSAGVPNATCIARTSTNYLEQLRAFAIDNQAEAKFTTGWLDHTVLMGVDYQTSSASARFGNGPTTYVNYLNPVYPALSAPPITTQTLIDRNQVGIYLQDQIRLGKLAVVAGVRNDWAEGSNQTNTLATGVVTNSVRPSDTAATWRVGATYLFDNGFAPYASYSTSFEPSVTVGTDYTGAAFKPTTGKQYEAGLKYQPVGLNGFFMLSYFDITQDNVLTLDTGRLASLNPRCTASGLYCQTQQGQVQSKGVELSGKVTLQPGLDVIAAYSHTNIEITQSTQTATIFGSSTVVSLQGKRPVGAAADTASLWMDYTFQAGPLAGFGFGGGVRYVGESYGDTANSARMVVPAYTLGDAQIHYDLAGASPQLKGWKLAVNMTNIFDKTYVSACASSNQCFYGNGRATLGTISYRW